MDLNLRINNIFSYVMVVSAIVFLYSLSFEIRGTCQDSVNPFNKTIVTMSFLGSALSAIFWQVNGYLRDKEEVKEKNHQNKINDFADAQILLVIVFILCLAVIIVFREFWKNLFF